MIGGPRRFRAFARPYRGRYLVGLLLLLLTNALALSIPWILREAIHRIEEGAALATVARLAALMAGVAVVQALVRTASRLAVLGNSRRIAHDIRDAFFAHLQRLGASYYDTHRTGDVMSRGVSDIQLVQSFFGPGVLNLLNTAIVYAAALVLLLRIDPLLTAVALSLYPVLFFVVNRISRHVYARSIAVQEQLAAISSQAQENISGIQQVKTYVQEERESERFLELCREFRRRNLGLAAVRGGMISLIGAITGAGTLVVLFVGGAFVVRGRMSFGDFVAFNAYLGMLAWPTVAFGWIINTFQRGAGAMRRLDEVLDEPPDPAAAADAPDDAPPGALGEQPRDFEIRGLTFAYPGAAPEGGELDARRGAALHDVSLHIPAGGRVAIVGPVGAGKSTLAHLLARVYPVPPGTIFYGGVDVTTIPAATYRRAVGYVPQEAFLFSRSLRDNVSFGDPEAGEREVASAIRVAHLEGDVRAFPEGLETVVGERGYTLSGGQRQRTTLARALVGDRRVLILDDSLASVDADTERAILEELGAALAGRTTVIISHRPSTLVGVDRIVVLDGGRIVEAGTHDELIARDGTYARIFRRQQLEDGLEGR